MQSQPDVNFSIDWRKLTNPVYQQQGWSVKDACMTYFKGKFHLFFSAFYRDRGRERSHVVGVQTTDFRRFSKSLFIWDGRADGWTGMCSPNLTHVGNQFHLTFNSWGDEHPNGKPNQLFFARSNDLETWGRHVPLAENITRGKRSIDAAIAKENGKYYLVWKENQTPQVAYANSLSGRWRRLGTPAGGWFENAELIEIDGVWHLVATNRDNLPILRRMRRSGDRLTDWLRWSDPKVLNVPRQSFNTNHRANTAFLADWRSQDGYFYLLYAGRTESQTHLGRGDNRLGLARSPNLKEWVVPRSAVRQLGFKQGFEQENVQINETATASSALHSLPNR